MIEWKRDKTRVYSDLGSYNCINIVTAETLHNILNNYENSIKELQTRITTENKYDEIQKQIKVVQEDLNKIKELLKWLQQYKPNTEPQI